MKWMLLFFANLNVIIGMEIDIKPKSCEKDKNSWQKMSKNENTVIYFPNIWKF